MQTLWRLLLAQRVKIALGPGADLFSWEERLKARWNDDKPLRLELRGNYSLPR